MKDKEKNVHISQSVQQIIKNIMYCEELTYTADNALQRLVQLSCITQGLLEEFTNQRILLKYQIFGQLIAAFDRYLFSYSS